MPDKAEPSFDAERLESTLGVLASQRRLHALVALRERGTPLTLSALAEEVAAREFETTPEAVPEDSVQRVYNTLYHVHVPKLEAAGIVEYDPDDGMVVLGEGADHVERVIDSVFDE
ncbi:MAG: hypothetical protein ABEJ28_11435 [Salinigranum sp.]